jgi:hypothetical protein
MKSLLVIIISIFFSNNLLALSPNSSYLCLIEFKKDKIELDSNEIIYLEGLISAINKDTSFFQKYEILFTPYTFKSEILVDRNIGIKRFNYLRKIIHNKTNNRSRLVYVKSKKYAEESGWGSKTGLVYYIQEKE